MNDTTRPETRRRHPMLRRALPFAATLGVLAAGLALWADEPPAPERDAGDRRGPRHPRRMVLTEEMEREVLEMIRSKRPAEYEQLLELKEQNPRRYRWVLLERYRWYRRYKSVPEPVQKALLAQFDAKLQIARIRKALVKADSQNEKDALANRLAKQVARHFDASQAIRRHYLERFEERLRRIREELKARKENRDELIRQEVETILANPELPDRRRRRWREDRGRPGRRRRSGDPDDDGDDGAAPAEDG